MKPIIATSLKGIIFTKEPWENAHELWFELASHTLKDDSILEWIGNPNYFKGVYEVQQRMWPSLTKKEQTKKSRQLYFNSVLTYIGLQNDSILHENILQLQRLAEKYAIGLVSSNDKDTTTQLLNKIGIKVYDMIAYSKLEEKDDKIAVFDRFISTYGTPELFVTTNADKVQDYCTEKKIRIISPDELSEY